jgi:hypothetical protein
VTILGPWDAKDDQTISLQGAAGDGHARQALGRPRHHRIAGGTQQVEIQKIELAPLS